MEYADALLPHHLNNKQRHIMPQHTVYLFYAPANQLEAEQLQRDLQAHKIGCLTGPTTENKVAQLQQDEHATAVLLVSDNYLKHLDEMDHLSTVFKNVDDSKLLPVITHGRRAKADNVDQLEVYATNIGTLNDVMRYRDFWYEEWIALRKLYKAASEEEQPAINERKEIAKDMSVGSISSHIRHINKLETVNWDEFVLNNYEALLSDLDLESSEEEPIRVFDPVVEDPTPESIEDMEPTEEETTEEVPVVTEEHEATPVDPEPTTDPEVEEEPVEEEYPVAQSILVPEGEETEEVVLEEPTLPEEENHINEEVRETEESAEPEAEEEILSEEETVEEEGTEEAPAEEEAEKIPVAELTVPEEEPYPDDLDSMTSEEILAHYDIDEVNDIDTLFHIAEAQLEEDQTAEARHTYERILLLDPYNGRALIWLARLLAKHDDQAQMQEAAHTYRKAIMVNDENAQIYYEYGLLQKDAFKAYPKAMDAFREALAIDAHYEDAYLGLAQCQRELGQHEAAKANYLQACILDAARFQTAEYDNYFDIIRHRAPKEELPADFEADAEEEGLEQNPNGETVVLVTGATSGIGQAIAGRFIMDGYKVILAGRRTDRLNDFKQLMEDHLAEAHVHCVTLDVREPSAVRAALEALPEGWADIDILVNNAGLAKGFAPIHEGDLDHWETMIDTNLKGLLYISRAVTPGMVARKRGHVINIGSVAGVQAYAGGGVYCATKAAVDSLTRSMRLDLYQHGIKVTAVHPGHVENTEFAAVRYEDTDQAKIYEDFKPLGAKDVADTVYYIATRPEHVNIQNVLLFGTQQASATDVDRSGREDLVIG